MTAVVFRARRVRIFWLSAVLPALVGAILVVKMRDAFARVLGAVALVGGLGLMAWLGLTEAPTLRLDDEGIEYRGQRHRWAELAVGEVSLRRRGRLGVFEAFAIRAPGRTIEIDGVLWPDVRQIHGALKAKAPPARADE